MQFYINSEPLAAYGENAFAPPLCFERILDQAAIITWDKALKPGRSSQVMTHRSTGYEASNDLGKTDYESCIRQRQEDQYAVHLELTHRMVPLDET